MRGLVLLFGALLSCTAIAGKTSSASPAVDRVAAENPKPLPTIAELALDAAKRWTQAAIDDSSKLQPLERDLLLIRLADSWRDFDRPKAHEYLNEALTRFKQDGDPDSSASKAIEYSIAIRSISSEVRALDRDAWNKLMQEIPKSYASELIAGEAETLLVESNDVTGAMELEKKSLERGGSMTDVQTLYSMIDSDHGAAGKLFDQIMQAAGKPDTDPNLMLSLVQFVFPREEEKPGAKDFFDERKQRVLDILARLTLPGNAAACNYGFAAGLVMEHFSPQLQGQLQPIISDCRERSPNHWGTFSDDGDVHEKTTDDLVAAMEAAPDVHTKIRLRELAVRHAVAPDHDYLRAIRLCIEESEEERLQAGSPDRFDRWVAIYASTALRDAMNKRDDGAAQNILNIVPPRIRAGVELEWLRNIEKSDRSRALLILSDIHKSLEAEPSTDPSTYIRFLRETSQLAPSNVTSAWRIVVEGLNQHTRAERVRNKETIVQPGAAQPSASRFDPLFAWPLSASIVADESFARASIEDLDSPEYREQFRIGMVQAFLSRYREALKKPAEATTVAADQKN